MSSAVVKPLKYETDEDKKVARGFLRIVFYQSVIFNAIVLALVFAIIFISKGPFYVWLYPWPLAVDYLVSAYTVIVYFCNSP